MLTRHITRWCIEPVESVVLQVPRALAASVASAVVDFAILAFLKEIIGWGPQPAAVAGYLAGGVLQYILCSVWVFPNSPKSKTVGFLAFTILSLGGLGITWAVMAGGEWLHFVYSAKVLALGLSFCWNFLSRKFLLFAAKAPAARESPETLADVEIGQAAPAEAFAVSTSA